MIELNASISTFSRQKVQIDNEYKRQSIAFSDIKQNGAALQNATNQENQIIDAVGISDAAIEKLNEAKALSDKLKSYLDYLNGTSSQSVVVIKANDNDENSIQIDAQSVKASANISYTKTTATQTDIKARFTNDGQLIDLEINQIRISEEELNVDLQSRILDLSIRA